MATLTALRKELDLSTAANIRMIAQLFEKIARENPEAVKAVFSKYLKSRNNVLQNEMVAFYADQAEYIKTLFDMDA